MWAQQGEFHVTQIVFFPSPNDLRFVFSRQPRLDIF